MKLRPQDVARQLKSIDPNVRYALIFGPDNGLVEERRKRLTRQFIKDLSDPFLYSELSIDTVKNDPTLVFDEVVQPPLTGEKRVICVRQANDAVLSALEGLSEGAPPHNFLILTAGNLTTSSKIRKYTEQDKVGVAIPCYSDSRETIDALLDDILKGPGLEIEPDARQFLIQNLGNDRGVSRSELEKLALYKGKDKTITLTDVELAIGDSGALALERVAEHALDGNTNGVDQEYERLIQTGTAPIAVIRIILNRLERLYQAALNVESGQSISDAVGSLRPPIFWKDRSSFERQLRKWNSVKLERAIKLLLDAEVQCKSSGLPAEEICGRTLLRLAMAGARG